MEERIKKIEEKITEIEYRNKRVERDKRWETSWVRRIMITILTYLVVVLFFVVIKEKQVFLKALVPVLGFVLSTISLRILRNIVRY
jgi:hypothetical protein